MNRYFMNWFCICALFLMSSVLSGCANDASQQNGLNLSPVKLFASSDDPTTLNGERSETRSAKVKIDEKDVKKAIHRYRVSKKIKTGSTKIIGADLNGDGRGEAIVYFQGEDWCISTGCNMLILQKGTHGFRKMTEVKRVKLPILVAATQSNGWRDIIVNTGNLGIGVRSVALKFNGNYPQNATTVKDKLAEIPIGTEILISEETVAADAR